MKQIVLTLCVFFAFITPAYSGELYKCIDRDGNNIITDNIQNGMRKCVLMESYKPSPEEPADKEAIEEKNKGALKAEETADKNKNTVNAEETTETSETRTSNCISSCTEKQQACYTINTDKSACDAEFQNCVGICNSGDNSSSSTQQAPNSISPMP
jgi:hypothetical protein